MCFKINSQGYKITVKAKFLVYIKLQLGAFYANYTSFLSPCRTKKIVVLLGLSGDLTLSFFQNQTKYGV